MAEMWICGECRSANNPGFRRCYRCGALRSAGELTEAMANAPAARANQPITILAAATRMGVRYRPTWPLALLLGVLTLATTAADVVRTRLALNLVSSQGVLATDQAHLDQILSVARVWAVGFILSGLLWSLWMALIIRNVPALTARWPSHGPLAAFFALWIPIIGLKRPYTIMKSVTTLLSDAAAGPAFLLIAWWITFLLSSYLPPIVVVLRAVAGEDRTLGEVVVTGSLTRIALVVAAALLAAFVLVMVEYQQHMALLRRSQVVLDAEPIRL